MKRAIDIHIGKRLKILREEMILSCSDLERTANISAGSVDRFEEGAVAIKASELFQIAEALQTTIGFFYKNTVLERRQPDSRSADKLTWGVPHHGRV